ncbi:MAG: YecA family protein [Candidatus Glassbacteria bacterium]
MTVGRNAPCPCGSGKKYKKCCLLKEQASSAVLTRRLLQKTADELTRLLMDYAPAVYGPECIDEAWDDFWAGSPPEEPEDYAYSPMFITWFLYHWYPGYLELYSEIRFPSEHTIAANYLAEHAPDMDPFMKRYIECARKEPLTFWEVQMVEPGKGMLLKDFAMGRERFVYDRSKSRRVNKWDLLLGHVVGIDGEYILSAMGPYPLPSIWYRSTVQELIDEMTGGQATDLAQLLEFDLDIIWIYQEFVDYLLHPVLPQLRNTDGEKLETTISRYSFDPAHRSDIIGRLEGMRNIDRCDDEEGGVVFQWSVRNKKVKGEQYTIKGHVRILSDHLITECNSRPRDRKLGKRLMKHLVDLITLEETSCEPFDQDSLSKTLGGDLSLDPSKLDEESRQILTDFMEEQFMGWADERIPELHDRTPREVVTTPEGRVQIANLINEWENWHLRAPESQFQFDFNKLRQELGLDLQ